MEKQIFEEKDYNGVKSTLCTGCGHDNVTQHIKSAFLKSQVPPFEVVKISGIGCSSKTPAYFMSQAHGFNSIHGRMAAVATGAKVANKNLRVIGISGDGDTASIGLGGFIHLLRRNLPMIYIVENNGVYGLTKGQFSATADLGSEKKDGETSPFSTIDLCSLAIESGCEFVARSFSGDGKQLVPLIQAALQFPGTAFIDVISPCITYANNEGSTKSYDYIKSHNVTLQELGYISEKTTVHTDYAPGESTKIQLASGSFITLKKMPNFAHDVSNRESALKFLFDARNQKNILTGLIYYNLNKKNFTDTLCLPDTPLTSMGHEDLTPTTEQFKSIMARYT